ncbi:MAG: hypothetical protein RIQ52_2106 [Pseudomonadota bacterium]
MHPQSQPDLASSSPLRGTALLENPLLNKGSAFSAAERENLGLTGLLPPHIDTLEQQVERAYAAFLDTETDLHRHIFLRQLQDTNEILFYRLLQAHLREMLPVIYTPTVGHACQTFSRIYRRPRGLFIAYPHRGRIREIIANRPQADVDVIVVSDGERILGLGDQGIGGMGIPIGKLSLYTLIGGIHPARTLPIILDVGTNNQALLNDNLYLGWRHERITGQDYFDFVDEFVCAIRAELPHVCLQWEDFASHHARTLLEKYRDELLSFNDDIQGTAAVALGAVLSALQVTGQTITSQQIVFIGAGSAGIGVADYLQAAMVKAGLTPAEACSRIYFIDSKGILHDGRSDLAAEQSPYAKPQALVRHWPKTMNGHTGLADVMQMVPATILIGLSTVAGAFSQAIVQQMASRVARPIIFPLSNPTSCAEATPEALIQWTEGRALIATGSPFPPVLYQGKSLPIAQCNNIYIFPAIGLALTSGGATRVTDSMLLAAAETLGRLSPAIDAPSAPLLPALEHVHTAVQHMAFAVAKQAIADGVAPDMSDEVLLDCIHKCQWMPAYA